MSRHMAVSFRVCLWVAALAAGVAGRAQDLPLRVGEPVGGTVTAASPKRSVELDGKTLELPGEEYVVEVLKSGVFAIEANSYFFDIVVVVRNADGKVVVVDNDGGLRTHSRATCSLETGGKYTVWVCALDGPLGDFEIVLREACVGGSGQASMSHESRLRAELEDSRTELAQRRRAFAGDHPDVARSLNNVAHCLYSMGRPSEAQPLLLESLEMRRRLFEGDHPDVATSLNNVAACLNSLGRSSEALPLLQGSLEMRRRLFEGDHPDVAASLNKVALYLDSLGRWSEALPLYRESLEMRRRLFAGEHPDVARSLFSVAGCLNSLGRWSEALPLLLESLEMRRRLFEGDHADVAMSLNNVAACLNSLGRPSEALPLYRESLEMRRGLFEGDHPNVATSLNNVSACLDSLGRSSEALPLFRESLEMNRRLFEGDHADVARSLHNVGACLNSLGRSSEALPLLRESLEMRCRLFAGDHADVASSLNDVAACLYSLGRWSEALPLNRESLEMRRRLFASDHPDVAKSLKGVATCLESLGRLSEALPLCRESLEMNRRLFASDHPDVAWSLNSMGSCLYSLGRWSEALPLLRESLEMNRRLFAGDHPDVAGSLKGVAHCLSLLGRSSEALPLFRESLEMRRRLFQVDHPDVAASLNNVATCLHLLGRLPEALPLLRESLGMNLRLFEGHHPDVALSLNNMATCLDSLGRPSEALPLYRESLEMGRRLFESDHPDVAWSLNNVAACLDALGRSSEALPLLRESLEMRRRLFAGDHPDLVCSLVSFAHLQAALGHSAEATPLLTQAITMIESLRRSAATLDRDTQQSYFAELKRGDPYGRMRRLQVSSGNAADALRYAERPRGRAMLDVLEESRFDLLAEAERRARDQGRPAAERYFAQVRERLHVTQAEVARLEHAVAKLASDRAIAKEDRETQQQALRDEMRTAYENRRQAVQQERAIVAELLPLAEPADPDQIQALVAEGELLLAFALDDKESHLFVVPPAPAPIEVVALPVQRQEIEAQANRLLWALSHGQVVEEDRGPGVEEGEAEDWQKPASALGKSLLPGVLWQRVRVCRRVWLLPDGPLHRTPFEVLVVAEQDGKPLPWLQDGPPIAYAPSGSALRWVRERVKAQRKQTPAIDLLALGDPIFQRSDGQPVPEEGALLLRVEDRGEAQRAGLHQLDVILTYDGVAIADSETLKQAERAVQDAIEAGSRSSDAAIRVAVWRQGSSAKVEVDVRPGALGVRVGPGKARAAFAAWERGDAATVARDAELERFGELRPLPGTRREVEGATAAFASDHARALFTGDATEAMLFSEAPKAAYVHLATHGLAQLYAGQSFCALALTMPAVSTEADNGFLTLEDLMTRWRDRLSGCRMVVMSACRTAIGRLQRDEAVHALPLGFFYAGASSVVGSLWNVNDDSTAQLMSDYYRRLAAAAKTGATVDRLQLLHDAKRELVRTHPDPFHWAPFLYFGSPE